MDSKWIGAVLIITACGGFGFSLCASHRREEGTLRSLIGVLDYLSSELHYHAPPLTELCRGAARFCSREIGGVFSELARILEENQNPDAASAMDEALKESNLPSVTEVLLHKLGSSLGHFDLDGQLKTLNSLRDEARHQLEELTNHRDLRLRNYQTLSVCAGAALIILLI